jgi:hypothetical protein
MAAMTAPATIRRLESPAGLTQPGIVAAAPSVFGLLPRSVRGKAKRSFTYGVDFLPLPATSTLQLPITVQNDSDFYIIDAVAVVTDVLNTTRLTFVPQLVQLFDSSSGRTLFNTPAHFHSVFGTVELPGWFSMPTLLVRSSTLTVQLQNLEATARNVRVDFRGFKVFDADEQ